MRRLHTLIAPTVVLLIIMASGGAFLALVEQRRQDDQRQVAASILANQAHSLERQMHRSLSATFALATFLRQHQGVLPNFDALAADMLQSYGGISSLQLAPGGVVSAIYPLPGNENALGHDLLNDPTRRTEALAAIETRQLTLAGPFTLLQGGVGVAGRLPVFLTDAAATERFWGFTTALIQVPDLIAASQLDRLVSSGYHYELSRVNPDSGQRVVFAQSDPFSLKDPVTTEIYVANGSWTLGIAPTGGWRWSTSLPVEGGLVVIIGALVASLTYNLLRQPDMLREEVEARTRKLAETNRLLEAEIAQRAQVEGALRESETRYRQMFEQNQAVQMLADPETGAIVDANPAASLFYGYDLETLKGLRLADIHAVPPETLAAETALATQAQRTYLSVPQRLASGEVREVEIHASPLDVHGQRLLYGIVHDVTERNRAEAALRETQRALATLMSNLPGMAYRCRNDADWTMEFVSEGSLDLTGYPPEDLIGNRRLAYAALIHPEDQGPVWDGVQAALQERRAFQLTYRIITASGEERWVWEKGRGVLAPEGELLALEGFVTDATERVLAYQMLEQRVEERTRELERRRQVAEGLRDILTILNSHRPLHDILDAIVAQAGRLLGTETVAIYRLHPEQGLLTIQAAQGLPLDYIATMSVPVGQGVVGRAVSERQPIVVNSVVPVVNDVFWYEPQRQPHFQWLQGRFRTLLAVPLLVKDDTYGGIVLYYEAVREFAAEEMRLAVAFADQVALAIENARLFDEAEGKAALEERQRLARELHDSVSQALYGIALGARTARTLLDRDPSRVADPLDYVLSLAEAGLAEMRALIFELRPESLATEGLVAALTKQAASLRARHGIEVATELGEEPDLPLDTKEALYRIAQETLHNTVKHARAQRVDLRLGGSAVGVVLEVRDDGVGFDPSGSFPGHLGLRSMRERAQRQGGTLTLESAPGRGTLVRVALPRRSPEAVR